MSNVEVRHQIEGSAWSFVLLPFLIRTQRQDNRTLKEIASLPSHSDCGCWIMQLHGGGKKRAMKTCQKPQDS